MISQRSIGFRSFALFWQLSIVTASFWGWLFIWESSLFDEPTILERYLLYNEFLLVGILLGSQIKRESNWRHAWVAANRKSFRQALSGLFCVFFVLFALKDTGVSRSFLFSYVLWLYLTLLFGNYFLPRTLAKWAFSGDREERVALVGTGEQAVRLQPWLERKNLLGLHTIGLISPQVGSETTIYPVLGAVDKLQEILRDKAITQLIVLDLTV